MNPSPVIKALMFRVYHFFWGCIPESRVIDGMDGSRTCELSCFCGKVETSITFPAIKGGYPPIPWAKS